MNELSELFDRRIELDPQAGDVDRRLAEVPDKPAVFMLADRDDRPILLATGLAVRTILRRRLSEPTQPEKLAESAGSSPTGLAEPETEESGAMNGRPPRAAFSRRADLRPLVRRLYLHATFSPFETDLWYLWLARRLFPGRFAQLVPPRHCWMIHAGLDEQIPRLAVTDGFDPPGPRVGPFAERQSANRLLALLGNLFELCHDYQVLRRAPHGRACEYKEMGRCSGVCDGTISLDEYRGQLRSAVEFAADHGRAWRARQTELMKASAGRLDFERAARIKDGIARAGELDHPRYRWLDRMDLADFLIVQPGSSKRELRTFRARAGRIGTGPVLDRQAPAAGLTEWIGLPPLAEDRQLQRFEAGLLSNYLFRADRARHRSPPTESAPADQSAPRAGLFVRYTGQSGDELAAVVANAFPPTVRKVRAKAADGQASSDA